MFFQPTLLRYLLPAASIFQYLNLMCDILQSAFNSKYGYGLKSNIITIKMGCVNSLEASSPELNKPEAQNQLANPTKTHSQPIIRNHPLVQDLKISIVDKFTVATQIIEMLDGLNRFCFTQNQAKDLSKALINSVNNLQQLQNLEDRQTVKELFSNENIGLIKSDQLLYYGLLDKLKEKKIRNISQCSKSRIYHTIANIKKIIKIEQSNKNQYGVQCIKTNNYKQLTDSELDQIVKYESITVKARQIGEKIGFKLESIRKQSQKMANLLTKCMKNHAQTINQMKFDLSESEVMIMAQISRQACNYHENGVFVLLVYFVESCTRLQQQQIKPNQIETLLKASIGNIYKQYPPGTGLSKEHEELINTLKELQNPLNYNKVDFKHEETLLTSTNKQQQIDKLITKYAQVAEQCKQSFEELVEATCLSKCVYFKIGLKYYPKNPNLKALTRIKEKMFFKKDSNEQKETAQNSVKQVLEKEQSLYRKQIDEILQKTDRVQFKISDMVRGKCVFLDVADIIYSVNEIKKFVAQNPQFGIAQIESRFTNKLPISDVTLKIVINNKIVAELQLTIQTNAAAYAFAHKIYELQRTKVFSKLKIVHNYFQESKDEFNQLAASALQLQPTKCIMPQQIIKSTSQYFRLDFKMQSFEDILLNYIKGKEKSVSALHISVDPLLQDLISVSFNLAIGKWGKDIGRIINNALKNEQLSPKLKSVIVSMFFNKFSLPKQSQSMQQFGIIKEQLENKIYMQEFIRQHFQIEQAFRYVKENQRLFHRAQELQQIIFQRYNQYHPINLRQTAFVSNLVIEQACFQKIKQLHELFNFYFITRKENNSVDPLFSNYSAWLSNQIKLSKDSKAQALTHQVKIVEAQYYILTNHLQAAQKHLKHSKDYFKRVENQQKVMQCQILLAQCKIKSTDQSLESLNKFYEKNVLQKASILGLEPKGVLYADSLQRIQNYLWQNSKSDNVKQKLLQTFTARALQQMSRSKGKEFIYATLERWPEYEDNKFEKPKIKPNDNVKSVTLKNIGAVGCEHLSKAEWKNINTLNLEENNVGDTGCGYLSKADWKNITTLYLQNNYIGDLGCEYLSKANWKNISTLYLQNNNIGAIGCKHLSEGQWKNITTLYLSQNNIGAEGCEYLSKAGWSNITTLFLSSNNIGAAGCEYISKGGWKHITTLNLWKNNIGDAGCEHLSKAGWKDITTLNLPSNNIGAAGCEHLSRAGWRNITTLFLSSNNIGDAGCQILRRADWKTLNTLYLQNCNIGIACCEYLAKAGWQKLNALYIGKNKLEDRQSIKKLFPQRDIKVSFT